MSAPVAHGNLLKPGKTYILNLWTGFQSSDICNDAYAESHVVRFVRYENLPKNFTMSQLAENQGHRAVFHNMGSTSRNEVILDGGEAFWRLGKYRATFYVVSE